MANLNKCENCNSYTLKYICPKCSKETKSAHYKFKKVRDAPPRSVPRKSK